MTPYRAVLFDYFGTLTGPVRGLGHATLARILDCAPDALAAVLGRSFPDRARGRFGDASATLRWVCRQLGLAPSAAQLDAAMRARFATIAARAVPRPEAVEVLTALRAHGLRTAVVSDCTHELPAVLPSLPVAPLLDARVFSVEVGECKPHPAMYATACRRLGVAPDECLYIGDGDSRELTGARRAGMTAVQLVAPDLAGHLRLTPDHEFAGPSVASLTEVVDLLAAPVLTTGAVTSPP